MHSSYFAKHFFEFVEQFEVSLRSSLILEWMNILYIFQRSDFFVYDRVIFHRAASQWIGAYTYAEVHLAEACKMSNNFKFAQFRQI